MAEKFFTKGIYSNGMVFQRNALNSIFGKGIAGKCVNLLFRNKTYTTTVDSENNWKIEFEAGAEGGPFEVLLTSENEEIRFTDVFVGEVWVSSGQSNAQLPMARMYYSYPDEFKLPKNNNIRMITIPISYNFDGEQDFVNNPTWKAASPETLGEMSGTAYFFAKKLSEELKVPVGIINASQGGSPISAWLSKSALSKMGTMQNCLDTLAKWENPSAVEDKKADMEKNQKEWEYQLNSSDTGNIDHWENLEHSDLGSDWISCQLPGDIDVLKSAGIVWFKKEVVLSAEQAAQCNSKKTNLWMGTIVDADKVYVNGTQVGITYYSYPPRRYVVPAGVLHEGKNTITVRVQKNSDNGSIRFYTEKPYCLFTDDNHIVPSVHRNLENDYQEVVDAGVYISLQGEWKMQVGTRVQNCPNGMFFEWVPTALYNSMLAPAFNYAVAGALWYQGESDAYQPKAYGDLLKNLIALWREKFVYAPKNMPFVIMQLPNWSDGYNEDFISENIGWPAMRQTQMQVYKEIENTGFAVTIDAGEWNDLHPEKKKTGGTRAAVEALRIAYKKAFNAAPVFEKLSKSDNEFIVKFETGSAVLKSSETFVPGFVFVSESKNFYEVQGQLIFDSEVKVALPETSEKMVELRYLWADSPKSVALYNSENIPAAAFKVDLL